LRFEAKEFPLTLSDSDPRAKRSSNGVILEQGG
jgi:hypothetical protein